MIVKELIEALQKLPEDATITDYEGCDPTPFMLDDGTARMTGTVQYPKAAASSKKCVKPACPAL